MQNHFGKKIKSLIQWRYNVLFIVRNDQFEKRQLPKVTLIDIAI